MRKTRKTVAALLAIALIITNLAGNIMIAKADQSLIMFTEKVDDIIGVPGETVHVKLPVRAINEYMTNPIVSVNTAENPPFTVKNITYSAEGSTPENPPSGIANYLTTYIEFDIEVKETAPISRNDLEVVVKYTSYIADDGLTNLTATLPKVNVVIEKEKEPARLTVDNIVFDDAIIGNDTKISFEIKNEGEIASHNTYFSVATADYEKAGIIPKYSKLTQEVGIEGKLEPGKTDRITLPVTISSSATVGNKTLTLNLEYKDIDGVKHTDTSIIYVTIDENSVAPKIEIQSTKYASELKAGDEFNLVTTLHNAGLSTASDIEVKVEGLGVTSFLPNYITETIAADSLEYDQKVDVKIPLIVSKEATAGLKEITVTINYKDEAGVVISTPNKLYLEIVSASGVDSTGKPNIVVSNVSQSPEQPNAGAKVDIFFDLENKSNIDISDLKIYMTNLKSDSFSPVNSEPYQYIEKLGGGKKTRITIPLTVSEAIAEGMSSLDIKYDFKDVNGKTWADNIATLYVLDIQNNGAASKPKLIISNFSTDIEELRAGSTFDFNIDIKNTHSNTDAKNIKVTISQVDNMFAVSEGSNSFYINEIQAGETVKNTLNMKVKADAVTKAYPVEVNIEYDYDGAEINPETGEMNDVKVKETINLQAVENARPVVNNVFVGSYDTPIVNQPAALTFEFYNMGKSPLNNVYATVEGDYTLSTGSMYFIGNVESGSSDYPELEVIPNVEGLAKGTLVITFEDSNGDEVKVTKDFEATVQSEMIPDFGEGGIGDPGVIVDTVKEPILPIWLFVILQIVILAVAIPVTRKTTLGLYRRKLRKQEEAE